MPDSEGQARGFQCWMASPGYVNLEDGREIACVESLIRSPDGRFFLQVEDYEVVRKGPRTERWEWHGMEHQAMTPGQAADWFASHIPSQEPRYGSVLADVAEILRHQDTCSPPIPPSPGRTVKRRSDGAKMREERDAWLIARREETSRSLEELYRDYLEEAPKRGWYGLGSRHAVNEVFRRRGIKIPA